MKNSSDCAVFLYFFQIEYLDTFDSWPLLLEYVNLI